MEISRRCLRNSCQIYLMRCWLLQTQISPQENFVLRSWNFSRDYCGNPELVGAEMWKLRERHQLLSETQRSTIIRILLITLFIFSSLSTLHKLYNCASNLLLHKFLMMRFLLHRTFYYEKCIYPKEKKMHTQMPFETMGVRVWIVAVDSCCWWLLYDMQVTSKETP